MTLDSAVQGVNGRTVQLLRPNGSRIPARVSFDADSREISVEPRGMLPNDRVVRVVLDGVRDADGNAVPRTVWRFRTADEVKPRLVKARPGKLGGIRPGATIRMWTNERVKGIHRKNAVVLREVGGPRVTAKVAYRVKARKLVINPRQRLDRNTRYVVVVKPKVQDLAGNRMARKVWRFRTK
jgi:Bacterial Ig-like domain